MRLSLAGFNKAETLIEAPSRIRSVRLQHNGYTLITGFGKDILNDLGTQAAPLEGRSDLDVTEKEGVFTMLNGQNADVRTVDDNDLQPQRIEVLAKVIGLKVVIPTPHVSDGVFHRRHVELVEEGVVIHGRGAK